MSKMAIPLFTLTAILLSYSLWFEFGRSKPVRHEVLIPSMNNLSPQLISMRATWVHIGCDRHPLLVQCRGLRAHARVEAAGQRLNLPQEYLDWLDGGKY